MRPSSTLRFDATKVQFVKVGNRVQETKLGFFGQSVAGGAISVIHRFTRDGEIITSRAMTLRR